MNRQILVWKFRQQCPLICSTKTYFYYFGVELMELPTGKYVECSNVFYSSFFFCISLNMCFLYPQSYSLLILKPSPFSNLLKPYFKCIIVSNLKEELSITIFFQDYLKIAYSIIDALMPEMNNTRLKKFRSGNWWFEEEYSRITYSFWVLRCILFFCLSFWRWTTLKSQKYHLVTNFFAAKSATKV